MSDNGAAFLIEGALIDRPLNAMTLTQRLHRWFGHTYRIDAFIPEILGDMLPIARTLFLTESRTIDPPSPRLLAIHRAVAHILQLSAAGEYIDSLLRDLEECGIRADGSTGLDRLVKLRLDGWPVGEVNG
ncbi:hypothetical protein LCI18_001191 [Fusarium solani-melongenae]|uniref:Uncharacterized protein n=1 Tax=Fusarium solani subsp. cucurbitae TaxID=2747967 RepID=A0ACD3YMX5_FUSSC|nr:hypothetical protein LCI18_001191 [Fusarium solani-melongenae]